MPEYNDPVARDALRDMRNRMAALERQVEALKSRGGVIMSRGPHDTLPAPHEGQTMLGMDGAPYYYADGAWHPFGGGATTTVMGTGTRASTAMSGGQLNMWFDSCYTNDPANMGFAEDQGTKFEYLKVTQPGIYLVVTGLSWNSDFTAGDFPYLEVTTYYPSTDSLDTLANSISYYDTSWQAYGPGLWNQQNTAAEQDFHSFHDVATVAFDPDDATNGWTGEAYTGFGARIRASNDRTKSWTINMSVTRLGPVGGLVYDQGAL